MSESSNEGLTTFKFDSSKVEPIKDYLNEATRGRGTFEHQDFNNVGHFLLDYPHGEYVNAAIEHLDMEAPSVDRYEFSSQPIGSSREIVYVLNDENSSALIGEKSCLVDLVERNYGSDDFISEIEDWLDEFFWHMGL